IGFQQTPITLSQSGGSLVGGTVTIYIRLRDGMQPGGTGAASRTITLTSTNATTTTAVLGSGYITGLQINSTGTSTYIQGAGPGDEKSFTVLGACLETTTQVLLTVGSNIEITTTSGNYTSPISSPVSLVITPGAIPNPKITTATYYYRLKSGLVAGTYADATTKVSLSADGSSSLTGAFTTKELQVTGTVTPQTVSTAQNISDLALPASGSATVTSTGTLTIDQDASGITINVQAGGKVTLADTKTLTSSTLTLQSGASGTATFVDNFSTPTVTATVHQYLTAERNWYTASPISAGTAAALNLGTSVQTYSEATKGWSTLVGTDALVNGKGYVSVAGTGTGTTGTVTFSGTLNSGTIAVPVTRTESGSSRGYNLVANPYPSYLDWSLVSADPLNATIGTTMWFRTKTAANAYTFSTYNSSGDIALSNGASTTISKFIPPMQAFWVRVNSGTATMDLTFKNSMRAHKDVGGNTFKAPKRYDGTMLKAPSVNSQQLIRLQISNGTTSDEAVVYFNVNALDAFDNFDSQKMFESASSTKPEIYSQTGAEQLAINGLKTIPYDTEIPLGFVTKQAGEFSIVANELMNFDPDTKVMLKDKLNATAEIELTPGSVYNFAAPITAASTGRFSLLFRAPGAITGVPQKELLDAQVFVNETHQITILANEKCNYAIYNALGQKVISGLTSSNTTTTNLRFKAGMYVVKLAENGKELTTKVFIK
ncbi:MAG: T9SS type A sorting domain-containing protein, partial [Bacteroidia bacterium]|nr:T9SS type A sorting domain-containing protein [Bacteroidia bacterium]